MQFLLYSRDAGLDKGFADTQQLPYLVLLPAVEVEAQKFLVLGRQQAYEVVQPFAVFTVYSIVGQFYSIQWRGDDLSLSVPPP